MQEVPVDRIDGTATLAYGLLAAELAGDLAGVAAQLACDIARVEAVLARLQRFDRLL